MWLERSRYKCLALLRAQRSAVPVHLRGSIERKGLGKWFSCLEATGGIRTAAKWTGSILNWTSLSYLNNESVLKCVFSNNVWHNMDSSAVFSAYMNPGCLQEIGITYSICKYYSRKRGRVCYCWSCSRCFAFCIVLTSAIRLLEHWSMLLPER